MRNYALVEGFWLSFFSREFYRSVAAHWRARSLLYLVGVLLLFWVPSLVKWTAQFHKGMKVLQIEMMGKFPPMTIDQGELHTPEARPYPISFGKGSTPVILIDTTGTTRSLEETPAQILVTRTQLMMRKSPAETRIYNFQSVKHFAVTEEKIAFVFAKIDRWLPIIGVPFVFALSLFKRLIESFLLAIAGLVLASMDKARLDLPELVSLAIVSLTPEMAVATALSFRAKPIHFQGLLLLVVAAGYFLFAYNAAMTAPEEPAPEDAVQP